MEKVANLGIVQEATKEGWKQHKVETVDPNHAVLVEDLHDFVSEDAIDCAVRKPQILLAFGANVCLVEGSVHIGDLVQQQPQILLAKDIVEVIVQRRVDKDWMATNLRQTHTHRLFVF